MNPGIRISDTQRRFRLAVRHRLTPWSRVDDVARITDDLVAIHSSDPVTVYLSLAARMATPTVEKVEFALYEEQSVIRHHAMRRTLWVMTPEILTAAHASTTRKIAERERKRLHSWLAETGIEDPETWLADATQKVTEYLRDEGPITTKEIGSALPDLKFPLQVGSGAVSSHSRILLQGGFEGRLVRTRPRGSWIASQYMWTSSTNWNMSDLDELDPDHGSDQILTAWLGRYGPGTERDIRWWTGWTAGHVRATLSRIKAEEVSLDSDEPAWIAPGDSGQLEDPGPWIALLPGLDSTTMGWKERYWYMGDLTPHLFDRNGNAGPTIWSNGQVIGGWKQEPDGTIATNLFETPDDHHQLLLNGEIDRITQFLGPTRISVRFPPPKF